MLKITGLRGYYSLDFEIKFYLHWKESLVVIWQLDNSLKKGFKNIILSVGIQ